MEVTALWYSGIVYGWVVEFTDGSNKTFKSKQEAERYIRLLEQFASIPKD